jgi:hypothetical protein
MVFSTNGVSGIKNFKYVCSGFLCCVCGMISVSSWLFLWCLNCGLGEVLFLSLVVNFSIAIFLLLLLDKVCSEVHIVTS